MSNDCYDDQTFGSPDPTPSHLVAISNMEEDATVDGYYPFNSPPPTSSQLVLIDRMEDEATAGPSTASEPNVIPETPPHESSLEQVRLVFFSSSYS